MGTPQVRAQLAYHNGLNELFAEHGLPACRTFVDALDLAVELGLISGLEKQRLIRLNSEANAAKHPKRWERRLP